MLSEKRKDSTLSIIMNIANMDEFERGYTLGNSEKSLRERWKEEREADKKGLATA